jgi:perosamine synthetase
MSDAGWVGDAMRRLQVVLPDEGAPYALHEPELGELERRYVVDCLDSGWVSSAGPYVVQFEEELARITGAAAAVACANGTVALQVALRLAGVGPGDEVLMPSLTFVGTANAAAAVGAVPHFLDVDEQSLGADPEAARRHLATVAEATAGGLRNRSTGRRIGAVVLVHVFGHPADLDGWLALAEEHGLPLLEDAAEALGSTAGGRHCGTFGLLGVLSFNGNKIITTGGGGAILTDDEELARAARHLTTTAKRPHRWEFVHDEVAYNFRLPNLNAALGCAQLVGLEDALRRKRLLSERYVAAFAGAEGLEVLQERPGTHVNHWLNTLVLDPAHAGMRDALLERTNDAGIMTRPVWTPLHRLPMYAACARADLPRTDSLAGRLVNLPSSPQLLTNR